MTDERLAELNATLADPPLFDLSGSDQLGLFIAGQLAKRHDVKITLRPSPYGGVTAVVLVPRSLVVEDEDTAPGAVSMRELGGRPMPELTGPQPVSDAQRGAEVEVVLDLDEAPAETVTASFAQAATAAQGSALASSQPFTVWTPSGQRADEVVLEARETSTVLEARETSTAVTPPLATPVRAAAADLPTSPPGGGAPPWAVTPASADMDEAIIGYPIDRGDPDDLPVRVRQTNLAPQLREHSGPDGLDDGHAPPPMSRETSPEVSRNTMAAWQRGWERGREAAGDMADEPRKEEGD
jgi:hypothetical protein